MNLNEKVSIKFILIFFIGLVLWLLGSGFLNLSEWTLLYEWIQLQDNTEKWMTFMSILSTLFAVFFVYTGFKIESTKEDLISQKREIENSFEYHTTLELAVSHLLKKQIEKATDILVVLKAEPFVIKDSNKLNTCYFFLANCFLELYKNDEDPENISKAYQFIDKAIEDAIHPLKTEIYEEFEKISESV